MTNCERCGTETYMTKMSFFNQQIICMECVKKERKHPKYQDAYDAELKAVQGGDHNFPGIGKPADL